jgi:hypothetical protein
MKKLTESIRDTLNTLSEEEPAVEQAVDLNLERGKTAILKAEGGDYERGLRVKLLEDGGYEIEYWYKDSTSSKPIEVVVDGQSVTKEGNVVTMLFHPEEPTDTPE